jgi:DNA processing protein
MDERLYWLWLQYVLGYASTSKNLIDSYGSAKAFYEAGESEWEEFFGRKKHVFKRCSEKSPEDFADTVDFCDKHSVKIVTPDSTCYPKNLLDIEDMPVALYVRGDCNCLNEGVTFGVIGSRTPCVYGENAAKNIVATLCKSGAVVVSGGALGIDIIAHRAAIENGGKTILVMGCGHGYGYLPENADLRKQVTSHGACISEYPPFTSVTHGSFPKRNRIISGISKAVVIVEAGERSGTFNTANHAIRQGRDLLVLPGDIDSGNFAGSNRLITEGAKAIFSGDDILMHCKLPARAVHFHGDKSGETFQHLEEKSSEGKSFASKLKKKKPVVSAENKKTEENQEKTENIIKNLPAGISKNAEIVYNIMSDGIKELDEIKRKSELEVRHILVALTELEILGFAEAYAPNCYRIK